MRPEQVHSPEADWLPRILAAVVGVGCRRPWLVLAFALLSCALCGWYTWTRLVYQTHRNDLIRVHRSVWLFASAERFHEVLDHGHTGRATHQNDLVQLPGSQSRIGKDTLERNPATLYKVLRQHEAVEPAFKLMKSLWQPDPVWTAFIDASLRDAPQSGCLLQARGA